MGEKRKFDKKKLNKKKDYQGKRLNLLEIACFFWRDEKKIAIPTETKIKTKKNLVS